MCLLCESKFKKGKKEKEKSLDSIYGDSLCVGVHVKKKYNFYNQIKFDIF